MGIFHDLNLSFDSNKNQLKRAISCAAYLGFDVVAVGHFCTALDKTLPLPAPPAVDWNEETGQGQVTKQLSRLTVVLSEGAQTHRLRADNVQSYDILAVQPTTEKMFQMACVTLEVDVISVNMTEKVPFYFKSHPITVAVERGIHFEIPYAPAIKDSTVRRYVISNAINLVRACRGRNIIISSLTNKALELRGPHDIANLGILFGMNENQAKDAVNSNCRAVMLHAATRKTIRSSMDVQEISQLPKEDIWKVKASQQASGFQEQKVTKVHQRPASRAEKKRKRTCEERNDADKLAKTQR